MNYLGICVTGVNGVTVGPDLTELEQKTQNLTAVATETSFSGGLTCDNLTVNGSLRTSLIPVAGVDLGNASNSFQDVYTDVVNTPVITNPSGGKVNVSVGIETQTISSPTPYLTIADSVNVDGVLTSNELRPMTLTTNIGTEGLPFDTVYCNKVAGLVAPFFGTDATSKSYVDVQNGITSAAITVLEDKT